jgi:hypothetical protein
METSKDLRSAYKNLENRIEDTFDNLTEGKFYDFLTNALVKEGVHVDELDEDEMIQTLSDMGIITELPCIEYHSAPSYRQKSAAVLSVEDGYIHILEDEESLITNSIKFRYLTTVSKINLVQSLEDYVP